VAKAKKTTRSALSLEERLGTNGDATLFVALLEQVDELGIVEVSEDGAAVQSSTAACYRKAVVDAHEPAGAALAERAS
jgi:hypothetical protein